MIKKIKTILTVTAVCLLIIGVIYGIGYINYKTWRVEHPQAKTWTFFIHNDR